MHGLVYTYMVGNKKYTLSSKVMSESEPLLVATFMYSLLDISEQIQS